jgi:hypothetical protein
VLSNQQRVQTQIAYSFMLQKNGDITHDLVKSLTKSEKRYVQLFASTHKKDSELSKMFSLIEKMEEYQESILEIEFPGKQIHVIKNRLNNLILKSMRSYHSKTSVSAELSAIIQDANFLYDRGLYAQSNKLIKKGIQTAIDYEKTNYLMELLDLEQRSLGKDLNIEDLFLSAKISKEGIKTLENKIDAKVKAFEIYDLVVRIGNIVSEEEAEKYRDSLKKLLEQVDITPMSVKALYFINSAKAMSYNLLGEFEKYYSHYLEVVTAMEKSPMFIKDQTSQYVSTLNNLINAMFALRAYDKIPETIKKIRFVKEKYNISEGSYNDAKIKMLSFDAELSLYIQTGNYEKGLALMPEINDILKDIDQKKINIHLLDMYYQIALVYFGNEDYRNALKWLNKVLNESETNIREDLHCIGRIFNLIIHIELNNQVILEYLLEQHSRFLNKKKRLYQLEKIIFFYLKSIIKNKNQEKNIELYKQFKASIEELSNDIFIQRTMNYFDFAGWIDSKIENKSFKQIAKRKLEITKA